jgi:hypothetical protein
MILSLPKSSKLDRERVMVRERKREKGGNRSNGEKLCDAA